LEALRWLKEENPSFEWDAITCALAAENGGAPVHVVNPVYP
jgi:hypothetical protein